MHTAHCTLGEGGRGARSIELVRGEETNGGGVGEGGEEWEG